MCRDVKQFRLELSVSTIFVCCNIRSQEKTPFSSKSILTEQGSSLIFGHDFALHCQEHSVSQVTEHKVQALQDCIFVMSQLVEIKTL